MRELRYRPLWLLFGWLLAGVIVLLSLLPHLPEALPAFAFSDKIGHLVAYAALMGWFVQLYAAPRLLLLHALLFVAMGVGLEWLQGLGGVRLFEYLDMVANTLGVALGLVIAALPLAGLLQRLAPGVTRGNASLGEE